MAVWMSLPSQTDTPPSEHGSEVSLNESLRLRSMAVRGTAGSRLVTAWTSGRRFASEHTGFAAMLIVVVSFVAWMVDIVVAPTIVGLATRGWPDERLLDPSLGAHMGSDATRFDVQVALVLVFLVPWVAAGVLVAIKTKTLVAAIAPAAVPAIVSTWLFFATETSTCELGDLGATDFIFLVSVGLAAVLAYGGGAIAARRERRPVVAIAILVASSAHNPRACPVEQLLRVLAANQPRA